MVPLFNFSMAKMVWMSIKQVLLQNLKHWQLWELVTDFWICIQTKLVSYNSHCFFAAYFQNQEMIIKKCMQELHKANSYIKELPSALENKAREFVHKFTLKEKNPNILKEEDFLKLMEQKYVLSLAQPGEPVGVLAAQSVGEPSTQMT